MARLGPAQATDIMGSIQPRSFERTPHGQAHRILVDERDYFDATVMCNSAGKRWTHYWSTAQTQAFVVELLATIECTAKGLAQHRHKQANGARHTWVHPQIAQHLQQWLNVPRRTQQMGGWVYAATSPHVMVKIGKWQGSLEGLRTRYLTPYGPELQLVVAAVQDMSGCEDALHCIFNPFALGGELFDKSCWTAVTSMLKDM